VGADGLFAGGASDLGRLPKRDENLRTYLGGGPDADPAFIVERLVDERREHRSIGGVHVVRRGAPFWRHLGRSRLVIGIIQHVANSPCEVGLGDRLL
jgi:hypothetical protein